MYILYINAVRNHRYNTRSNYKLTISPILPAARSFIGLVRCIFALLEVQDNGLAFLSNICQDPLEKFFREQRQRGCISYHPSAQEFLKNTAALRVINSFCRGPRTGNCRGSDLEPLTHKENTPLQHRSTFGL